MSIEYAYDKNGNLSRDDNKGMTFTYDLLGHPLAIVGSSNQTDYVYSADGRKLRATHTQYTSKNTVKTQVKTNYRGRIVANDGVNIRFLFSGGFYTFKKDTLDVCHYFIQDYQGNNRILIGTNKLVDQYSHYYPYGGLMGDISTNDAHSYKYGGKELDRDFGIDLFDFEARQYDAKVPGFTSIDPLAEKYYGISPYAYCAGDPVNCVDPTGMYTITVDPNTGKIEQSGEKNDYDELVIKGSDSSPLRVNHVNGESVLTGLVGEGEDVTSSTSSSSTQLIDAFFYLAANTEVEWSLQVGDSNGKNVFALGTTRHESHVDQKQIAKQQGLSDVWLKMHSHPDEIFGTAGGSPDADMPKFRETYKNADKAPLHLVCRDNIVYFYNGYRSSFEGWEKPASKFKSSLKIFFNFYKNQQLPDGTTYITSGKPKK